MELDFQRHDVLQVTTTLPNTLAVLPVGQKKTQKVAVGDLSGVVQCFTIRKGDVVIVFKTLPTLSKVTCMTVGRAKLQRDKIIVAQGTTVKGYTKKGKEFFRFNTSSTEAIRKVEVLEKNVWTMSEFFYNLYTDGKARHFYLSPDRINSAEVLPLISNTELTPVLACNDRCIRIVRGSNLLYEVPTRSPPTCIRYVPESHDPLNQHSGAMEVLCGLQSGEVLQVFLDPTGYKTGFTITNDHRHGAVTAIFSAIDYSKTGCHDIVVGHDDGVLEVYDVDNMGQPVRVFQTNLQESINAIDGGFIASPSSPDIIVLTFGGKVVLFSSPGCCSLPPSDLNPGQRGTLMANKEQMELLAACNIRAQRLRDELEELRNRVDVEKSRLMTRPAVAVAPQMLAINESLRLLADEGCHQISVQCAVPMFALAVQSTLPVELLDAPSNVAIVSHSPPDPGSGNMALATYRCQDSTNRLSVQFKVKEGQAGTINVYVIPQSAPMTSRVTSFTIRPLCLHQRITDEVDTKGVILSEMVMAGSFTLSEAHSWLTSCLPDLPVNIPGGTEQVTHTFRSVLTRSLLICRLQAGEARFQCEVLSPLSVLHQSLMQSATNATQRVNTTFSVHPSSLHHSLKVIWPKLEAVREEARKNKIREALRELQVQDGDVDYLPDNYKQILKEDNLPCEPARMEKDLEDVISLVKDLFLDYCRLSRANAFAKQRVPQLVQMLKNTGTTFEHMVNAMSATS